MAAYVPAIDYSSKDYTAFKNDLLAAIPSFLPEWTSRDPNDFGIVLIELFAMVGDTLSYYGDRIANEAYLPTAVRRSSVLMIAQMLDYRPSDNVAATVTLQFTITVQGTAVTIPAKTQVSTVPAVGATPVVFETDIDLVIPAGQTVGSVTATQGVTWADEAVGTSNGALDLTVTLFHSPVIEASPLVSVDEGFGAVEWTFIEHLIDANSTDNVYTTFTDENGILNVVFGDNVNGRIPPLGSAITATYRVGGGSVGNVGAGALTQLVYPVMMAGLMVPITDVSNPQIAQGGADAESLDSIRKNAPAALTTLDRAVTLADYAHLALKVAGVSKAIATASVYTAVSLYIAVAPGSGTLMSAALRNMLTSFFTTRQMVNATITLLDATYVPIYLTVAVNVKPQYKQENVRQAVIKALKVVLAFDNVDFAQRVTVSMIYQAVGDVDGVDYAVVSVVSRTNAGLADVVLATNEIPTTDDAHLAVTATGGIF